jgi:hypothetical protein
MRPLTVVIGALLGAAALGIAVLPSEPTLRTPVTDPLTTQVRSTLNTLRLRETFAQRLEARYFAQQSVSRPGDVVTVVGGAGISPAEVARYDSLNRRLVASLPTRMDTAVRVVVTLLRASAAEIPDSLKGSRIVTIGTDVFVPGSIRPNECHVIVRAPEVSGSKPVSPRLLPDDAVSPCIPYLLYGMPGTGMTAWLAAHGLDPVRAFDPRHRGDVALIGTYGPWNYRERRMLACRNGRTAACDDVVLGTPRRSWSWFIASATEGTPTGWIAGARSNYLPPVDPSYQLFVEALHDRLGPDGLRALWQADAPIIEAVASATGQPLSRVVRDALDADSKRSGAKVPPPRPLGSLPYPSSVLMLLLLSGGMFGAVYALTQRRNGFG